MSQIADMRFYSSGPWTILKGSKSFQVEDATGFPLLNVPFEDEGWCDGCRQVVFRLPSGSLTTAPGFAGMDDDGR